MPKFNAAIIGAGKIGYLLEKQDPLRIKPCTHWGMLTTCRDFNPPVFCEITCGESIVDSFGTRFYGSFDKMIKNHGEFDLITVATPTNTHFEVGMKAAQYARVLFMEKPITETIEQADELIAQCRRCETVLMVNHTRRWDTFYRDVKTWVPDVKFFIGKFTGDWLNVGIHMFDLVNWYGAPSSFIHNLSEVTDGLIFDIEVYGKTTAYILRDNGFEAIQFLLKPSEKYGEISEYQKIAVANPKYYHNPWLKIAENIVNVLEEKEEPYCSGEQGLAALRLYLTHIGRTPEKPVKNLVPIRKVETAPEAS